MKKHHVEEISMAVKRRNPKCKWATEFSFLPFFPAALTSSRDKSQMIEIFRMQQVAIVIYGCIKFTQLESKR